MPFQEMAIEVEGNLSGGFFKTRIRNRRDYLCSVYDFNAYLKHWRHGRMLYYSGLGKKEGDILLHLPSSYKIQKPKYSHYAHPESYDNPEHRVQPLLIELASRNAVVFCSAQTP